MVTHSSIFAWKIPWTEESGRLQPMGSQRVRYNLAGSLSLSLSLTHTHTQTLWPLLNSAVVSLKQPLALRGQMSTKTSFLKTKWQVGFGSGDTVC